jgi:hypothetical protein
MVNPPQDQVPDRGVTQLGVVTKDPTSTILLLAFLQISLFESGLAPKIRWRTRHYRIAHQRFTLVLLAAL